jgi:catechol 2,3-dioxygenase-like lactoylglutathione lyase family enzyme
MNTALPAATVKQQLAAVALLVDDYDTAIAYYTRVLGFELIEDTALSASKRWVLVAPPGANETRLLLAQAATEAQRARIGDQAGGRVFLFLHTNDFDRDFKRYRAAGVVFTDGPRSEPYGKVGVFQDRYGNRWDLIERSTTEQCSSVPALPIR